jgi:peptide/nickel transport system substrate-binding protein
MRDELGVGGWRRRIARRAFVRGTVGAGAAIGVVSLSGCTPAPTAGIPATAVPAAGGAGAAAPTPPPAATQAPAAKYGGVYKTVFQADAGNMDPHLNTASTVALGALGPAVVFSKLIQFRSDVKPTEIVPTGDLAESWEQPDDRTFIFKLRRNAKWQNLAPVNGREVVAADIKYSYERQIASGVQANRLPVMDKIEVVDPYTLRLVGRQPDADFLVSLAFTLNKIVPHEVVDLKGDLKEGPLVGSGPWILEKWERGKITSFAKSPDYYLKGFPRVDRMEMYRIPDAATAQSAFRAGELDTITTGIITAQDGDALRKTNPQIVYESYRSPLGISLHMNASKPPYNDIRVRQAIFKAIDKQAIMDTLFSGQAWYVVGLRLPSEDAYLPDAEIKALYKQDQAAARQLLSAAGVTVEPELYALSGGSYKDVAELIQADLAKIGVTSRIRVVAPGGPWANDVNEATGAGYDIAVGAIAPSSPNADLVAYYHSSGNRNFGKAKDPALDALIDRQAVLVKDPEGRKKILQDIQRNIINSAQYVFLAGLLAPSVRWSYVKDYFFAYNMEETYPQLWLDK